MLKSDGHGCLPINHSSIVTQFISGKNISTRYLPDHVCYCYEVCMDGLWSFIHEVYLIMLPILHCVSYSSA